jgi:hypothetical protein
MGVMYSLPRVCFPLVMASGFGLTAWILPGCTDDADDDSGPSGDDDSVAGSDDDDSGGGDDDDASPDPCEGHCGNGVLDCGEIEVDCGGECSSCAPEMVWGEDAEGKHPAVVTTPDGRVMVLFGRGDRTIPIQYSCFDGEAWTPLADVTSFTSWRPNPVADDEGNIHLVYNTYEGPGEQAVYHSVFSGGCFDGVWSEPERLSVGFTETDNSTEPCIDIAPDGTLWAAWSHSLGPTGGTTTSCDDDGECDIHGAGLFHCSYNTCRPYYDAVLSTRTAGQWASPGIINAGMTGYFGHVAIAVQDSSTAVATFMKGDHGVAIWYSQYNGSSWGTPTDTGLGLQFSEVVVQGGYGHVLSNSGATYRRKALGGDWEDGISLGSGDQDFPDLDVDGTGRLHAVWPGSHQIYYRIGDADTGLWPDPAVQVSTNASSSHPWVDADAGGYAHIVWAGGEDAGPIWYFKIRYEDLD